MIELLALGEPLRLQELVSLAGLEATTSVEAHGIIRLDGASPASTVRLAHPLYGDVVRASMPLIRAAQTRRDLARTVRRTPDRSREDALLIARWLLDAGDPVPADLTMEAAAAAIAAGDPELGERLGRMALDGGAGGQAALLVARACAVRQRYEDAEEVLAPLEGAFETQEPAIAYLQQRVVGLMWGLRRAEDAMALVTRALGWWDEPAWRRKLTPIRLRAVAMTTDFRIAGELSAQALADETLEPAVRRQVEVIHAVQLFGGGRVRQAYELIVRLRPPIPLRDEVDELAMMMSSIAGIESGWAIDEVERWMSRALREAIRTYDETAAGISAGTLGGLCMLRGRYVDAARWLREALVHLEYHDPFWTLKCAHALLAGVAYYIGDREGVAAAMERCRAAITSELLDTERAYVVRGEAWLALAHGDPSRAQRLLLDCAEGFSEPLYAMQLYHEAMRAGAPPRRVAAPLAALRDECDARLAVAYADDALARAHAGGDGRHGLCGRVRSDRRAPPRLRVRRGRRRDLRPGRPPGLRATGGRPRPRAARALSGRIRTRGARARPRRLEPHREGEAAGRAGGAGIVQPRDRRSTRAVGPHRRVTPVPGDAEARRQRSPRSPNRAAVIHVVITQLALHLRLVDSDPPPNFCTESLTWVTVSVVVVALP